MRNKGHFTRFIGIVLALMMLIQMSAPAYALLIAVTEVSDKPGTVLTAKGGDWTVRVALSPDESWPEGMDVRAEEVVDGLESYLELLDPPEETLSFARFFEISLVDANGEEIQPEGRAVKVEIVLPELEEDVRIEVVHFRPEENGEDPEDLARAEELEPVFPILRQEPAFSLGRARPEALTDEVAEKIAEAENLPARDEPELADSVEEELHEETADENSVAVAEPVDCSVVELEGGEKAVAFEAEGFSIYAVLGTDNKRIIYNFYNGETPVATQYVKPIDSTAEDNS